MGFGQMPKAQVFSSFQSVINELWTFVINRILEEPPTAHFINELLADEEDTMYSYGFEMDVENLGDGAEERARFVRSYLSKLHNRDRLHFFDWFFGYQSDGQRVAYYQMHFHAGADDREGIDMWSHLRDLTLNQDISHPYLELLGMRVYQGREGFVWDSPFGTSNIHFDTMGKAMADAVQLVERRCIEKAGIDMDAWLLKSEPERLAICQTLQNGRKAA